MQISKYASKLRYAYIFHRVTFICVIILAHYIRIFAKQVIIIKERAACFESSLSSLILPTCSSYCMRCVNTHIGMECNVKTDSHFPSLLLAAVTSSRQSYARRIYIYCKQVRMLRLQNFSLRQHAIVYFRSVCKPVDRNFIFSDIRTELSAELLQDVSIRTSVPTQLKSQSVRTLTDVAFRFASSDHKEFTYGFSLLLFS